MAEWLNSTFAGYDHFILNIMHQIAEHIAFLMTPLMRIITIIGEKGILMFLIALGLMCFSKTRKSGICVFGAVCCGVLITNIILKDWVCRPRPLTETATEYYNWWLYIGAFPEDEFSFPSGHVTAAMAGVTAICLNYGKKYIPIGAVYVFLMGVSRNYLMAHYPSDVLAAVIIGAFSASVAYLITQGIYYLLEKNKSKALCKFILNFDIIRKKKEKVTCN